MAEAVDHAVDGERRDVGVDIFQQRETGFRGADFGDGRGDRARQHGAAGDRRLRLGAAGGDEIDEIGFEQQRRARQDRHRDLRLVGGQRIDDDRRRVLRGGEDLGQRLAHQRRRVVEQHDHRAFGGGAVIGRKVGVEIGARQGGRGIGPVTGLSGTDPLQKLTDNHRTPPQDANATAAQA